MSEHSVKRGAKKIVRIVRIFGYGTFSFRDHNNEIYVSVLDIFWLSLNIFTAALVFCISCQYGMFQLTTVKSILMNLGMSLTVRASSAITLISIISFFVHRKKIWRVVILFDQVDCRFRKINVDPNFITIRKRFSICVLGFLALFVIGVSFMAFGLGYTNKFGVLVIYAYESANFATAMGWTAIFHFAIYVRLRLANKTLR